MTKNIIKIGLVIAVVGSIFCGCPRNTAPEQIVSEKKSFSKEELQKRYDRLEVRYDIMQKDDPPQQETLEWRNRMVDAKNALKKGELEKAATLIKKSEEWISKAGPRYYRAHQERINSGKAEKSGRQLMTEALDYLETAKNAEKNNKSWTADRYYRAAMEHGELALLTERQSPQQAMELIELYPSMREIYEATGASERAAETRNKVVSHIQTILRNKEQQISNRLSGKAAGYDQKTLSVNKAAFDEKAREVRKLNREYLKLAGAAQSTFPESRFQPMDYSRYIAKWIDDWHRFFEGAPVKNDEPQKKEKNDELKKKLEKHNRIKRGAKSIEGSGIVLEELSIFTYGPAVFIKGKLQNKKSHPIYKPRVVVTGNLMSDVVDIGYYKMSPLLSSTFQMSLKHFTTEAFTQNNNMLPSHELMVIFKDEPGGPDIKLLKPVK